MASTVVHLALGVLIAAGLLGDEFDARSLAVVLVAVAIPDLDAFAGFVLPGGHRALLHSLLLPVGLGALLYHDTTFRERSVVLARWGERGVRVAWVALAAVVLAAIGLDVVTGDVNLLYPLHDQFYRIDGKLVISNQRGIVQTFVEQEAATGTTETVHVTSGVDPNRGAEPENVERIFPIVRSGWQLLLVVTSVVVGGVRLRQSRNA
jgi:hypothetical protein